MTRVSTRIEIAPGANPAGDPSEFVWVDAGKRRRRVDIEITGGRDDEASVIEAGSFSATMDNRDGRLSPRNPLGQYFGQIGRGTPIRCILERTSDDFGRSVSGSWGTNDDGFTWTQSNAGGTYGVNGSQATIALPTGFSSQAVLVGAGSPDSEIVWSTTLDAMPTGGSFVSAGMLRYSDGSNYLRGHVELEPAGTVSVKVQRRLDGDLTEPLALTATGVTYSAGVKVWGKARADGPYVMVKTWTGNRADEPDVWHGVATDDTLEGPEIGLLIWRINSNVGTYTAKIDDVEIVNIVWSGNVPEWSPRWPEKSGTDSTLPVSAAGILRRLQQGKSRVNSPLFNQLVAQQPFTYFPLEEATGANSATSVAGTSAQVRDIKFGSDDTLGGAAPVAVMNTLGTSQIQFSINSTNTPNGWACLWFFKLESLPSLPVNMVNIKCSGTMQYWDLIVANTGVSWEARNANGDIIADSASTWQVDVTQWVAMQVETNVSGGTVTVSLIWHQVGGADFWSLVDTFSGTSPKPDRFSIIAASDSQSVAHLWAGDNDLPFVDATFALVADGYPGETAGDRIDRICRDAGIPLYRLAGDTEPMGRQLITGVVDLLRDCEKADQGILCERGNAVMYIPRVRRYNMPSDTPVLQLDWSLGHLDEAPEPTDDDQRFRNLWKVSSTSGGEVIAADEESILRTATYDDSIELNLFDDSRLIDFGKWLLSQSTADYLRWPRVRINLVAHPEFIQGWLSCRIGSRITIANPPSKQLAGEVIDLIVEGFSESINNDRWIVELACSPAQEWKVGEWDSAQSLWSLSTCTLASEHSAGTTTLTFAITGDESWSSAYAYDLLIAGEVVGIPVGGMAARTGTAGAYAQVATGVTRAKNLPAGKVLPSGSSVTAVDVGRWGL